MRKIRSKSAKHVNDFLVRFEVESFPWSNIREEVAYYKSVWEGGVLPKFGVTGNFMGSMWKALSDNPWKKPKGKD